MLSFYVIFFLLTFLFIIFAYIKGSELRKEEIELRSRKFSESDLLKAVQYACEYQKGVSYSEIARIIHSNKEYTPTEQDVKILDHLVYGKTAHNEITIDEIYTILPGYVEGKKELI